MSISSDLMYRLLVQGVSDYAIFMVDRDGIVLNWNAGAERAKGYTVAEIVGRNYELFYSPDDRSAGIPRRNLDVALRDGRISLDGWRYRQGGTAFWASITIDAIYDTSGAFLGCAKITRDLTKQHELLSHIDYQAHHDALTHLLNRAGLFKRLDSELEMGRPSAVYCIDLDNFKPVNDRLGHAAGDGVLGAVAQRLTTIVRGLGFAGRIGGDEFVVVQSDGSDMGQVLDLGNRIVSTIGAPITIDGKTINVGASVGVARARAEGRDTRTLLRRADTALYQAKETGRNRVVIHAGA